MVVFVLYVNRCQWMPILWNVMQFQHIVYMRYRLVRGMVQTCALNKQQQKVAALCTGESFFPSSVKKAWVSISRAVSPTCWVNCCVNFVVVKVFRKWRVGQRKCNQEVASMQHVYACILTNKNIGLDIEHVDLQTTRGKGHCLAQLFLYATFWFCTNVLK